MITGVWKGKINRQKVEVKIIQKGDSLTGTSYYYESATHYRRYSIKGYFDPGTNEAVWWDDQLLEEKAGRFSVNSPGKMPLLARADFNCPDGGKMTLDGKAISKDIESNRDGQLHLNKEGTTDFEDEWDFIIDNYLVGGNDPELIDSIASIARQPFPRPRLLYKYRVKRNPGKKSPWCWLNQVPSPNLIPCLNQNQNRNQSRSPNLNRSLFSQLPNQRQ